MAMTINTNIASLNAQRNLTKTQNTLGRSLERLSSGLRINSAKDDAAGLAISTRFSAQVRGLDQSVRNANDGISLLQTSEGAMQEVTSILQRMREIAVQASNDTYSTSDRASLQGEVDQLYSEIDRISTSTQFNGISLLDGKGGTRSFQIGANAGQDISVELKSVSTADLELNMSPLGELNSGRVGATNATGLTINGTAIGAATASTAAAAATAINLKTDTTGVTASAYNTARGTAGTGVVATGDLMINSKYVDASNDMTELVDNINKGTFGVTATLNTDNSITLSNDTGDNIVVENKVATNGSGLTTLDGTAIGTTATTRRGFISLVDDSGQDINITATGTTALLNAWGFNQSSGDGSIVGIAPTTTIGLTSGDLIINGITVGTAAATTGASKATQINLVSAQSGVSAATSGTVGNEIITLTSDKGEGIVISGANVANAGFVAQGGSSDAQGDGLSVGSVAKANEVIDLVDNAMNIVSANRADMGAVQNRLDSTISNLMNVSENLSAANGRIVDADFAGETSNMSKQQILMQAGVAMLAQAKQLPQQVLQLLQ
jgi:flagellin